MSSASAERSARPAALALGALVLADVAFAFQQTAVIPVIPTVQRQLHAGQTWSAWLLSGYLIASSIATPLLGKLGDRHGRRRLLSVALGLFLVGSIGAALAPSIGVLIAFRALQGAGGAVFPLTLSIARERLPQARTGLGTSLLTGAFGLGTTLGFAVSGLIVAAASWRWVFGAGAIAILAASIALPLAVPRSEERAQAGLDLVGGLLLTGGIALVLFAITEGVPLGWGSWQVVAAFAAGIAALGGWAWHDTHTADPLLDLRVLASRTVLSTNGATALLGYVLFSFYFLVPYLVAGHGHGYGFAAGPWGQGAFLVPAAVGQLLAGLVSGALAARLSSKWTFTAGMAAAAAAAAWLALAHAAVWEVLVGTLVLGLGAGLSIGVASELIVQSVSRSETGIATSLNSVIRRVGGGLGSQVGAALLASLTVAGGTPSQQAFVIAFWSCAACGAVGAVLAAAITA